MERAPALTSGGAPCGGRDSAGLECESGRSRGGGGPAPAATWTPQFGGPSVRADRRAGKARDRLDPAMQSDGSVNATTLWCVPRDNTILRAYYRLQRARRRASSRVARHPESRRSVFHFAVV